MTEPQIIDLTPEDGKMSGMLNAIINTFSTLKRFGAGRYGQSPDGKRNFNATFGYPEFLSYADFRDMYERGGIAHAVVAKVAKACWRDSPKIMVDGEPFSEQLIEELKEAGLFDALERADILNRIGTLSILLIGVQDGNELDEPIGTGGNLEDVYFNVYSDDGITITKWEEDAKDKRFGLPVIYQLETTNLDVGEGNRVVNNIPVSVHWSRVVHLAEGALQNPIQGMSALKPVYNALLDKDKVRGSSSEAFYRNARQKFALMADKDAQIDNTPEGKAALQSDVEAFTNDQQDFLKLKNFTIDQMQPGMVSPRDTHDICVEEISGQTGIPIRILTTKAGGQTNGIEDKASWNSLIGDRQESDCTGWFVSSLRILENATVIGKLPKTFTVKWSEQSALTEKERSEVTLNNADALQKLAAARSVSGGDEIDMESALKHLGFEEIEIDKTVPTGRLEDEL